jgi:ribonucleotide monophosphatase NagD (HAD superfamily)
MENRELSLLFPNFSSSGKRTLNFKFITNNSGIYSQYQTQHISRLWKTDTQPSQQTTQHVFVKQITNEDTRICQIKPLNLHRGTKQ